MRVIGVIDLLGGQAVHARGGKRDDYAPVGTAMGRAIDGDAAALAAAYRAAGLDEIYVADLDAILGGWMQRDLIAALEPAWLDAGITSDDLARDALTLGVGGIVVGLETLPSWEVLDAICDEWGGDDIAFSLDLRNGEPVGHPSMTALRTPISLAHRAAASGVATIVLLDLARVGTGGGLDLDLIRRVRDAVPDVALLAGGGVRGRDDLLALEAAGCDGALVASALHDGRLTLHDTSTR